MPMTFHNWSDAPDTARLTLVIQTTTHPDDTMTHIFHATRHTTLHRYHSKTITNTHPNYQSHHQHIPQLLTSRIVCTTRLVAPTACTRLHQHSTNADRLLTQPPPLHMHRVSCTAHRPLELQIASRIHARIINVAHCLHHHV
jgi:hypothetical protein